MAKATGISSQFRGKVGNVIGYLTKNRAGKYEQTVKSYQPVVANPQSFAQALSRVPVGPTQRICSALLPIVQRGFEGVDYGDAAKSEFLSYNLKYFRGPFLEKSYPYIVPGPMLLTRGSLRSVGIQQFLSTDLYTYIYLDRQLMNTDSIAAFATQILNRCDWVSQGEQWTLVISIKNADQYTYQYYSFYIDPNSNESFPSGIHACTTRSGQLYFSFTQLDHDNVLAAGAIIRSQPYGSTSFRRSTTFLTCNADLPLYNTEDDVRRAVASYRTGEDPEDWQDDPTPEYQQIAYLCMITITSDMVTNWASISALEPECLGYMTKGGTACIFYGYDTTAQANVLLGADGTPLILNEPTHVVPLYDSSYLNAREYSTAYGIIDEV